MSARREPSALRVLFPATASMSGARRAVTARLTRSVDQVADDAAGTVDRGTAALPADADPLLDLLAEVHATRKDRFFAS